jgi:hypothetical protein
MNESKNPPRRSFAPSRWNAWVELLCCPLENLNAIQRPAALVFDYDGHVQNGGHSSHLDSLNAMYDDELLQALRAMGAHEQARILAEARILKREADEAAEDEQPVLWELIEALDVQYYRSRPNIPELLAKYFDAHRESFPE